MLSRVKQAALASALAAVSLTSVTPAMAQGYPGGYRHRDHGDNTGAIVAGVGILAVIAAIAASSGNKDKHRGHYRGDLDYRDGSYYDGDGRRCDRDGRPYDDGGQGYYQRRGYNDGYGGGYGDRGYDNRGYGDRGYYRGN